MSRRITSRAVVTSIGLPSWVIIFENSAKLNLPFQSLSNEENTLVSFFSSSDNTASPLIFYILNIISISSPLDNHGSVMVRLPREQATRKVSKSVSIAVALAAAALAAAAPVSAGD